MRVRRAIRCGVVRCVLVFLVFFVFPLAFASSASFVPRALLAFPAHRGSGWRRL
jgi:hypothetical protein